MAAFHHKDQIGFFDEFGRAGFGTMFRLLDFMVFEKFERMLGRSSPGPGIGAGRFDF